MPSGPATAPAAGGRLAALDGLRAVAVIAVLAYHGGLNQARGGFLGVDLFFVLSGYLITTLLVNEWERSGSIALAEFWWRRARRLLPALLTVLLALGVYVRLAGTHDRFAGYRGDAFAALAYVANWHFIAGSRSYFAATGAPSLLQHTWSLAIEEQFYVIWPVIVVLVLGAQRARRAARAGGFHRRAGLLLAVCGAGAVASAIDMGVRYRAGTDPSRVYFGTDTHGQSLLAGCALGVLLMLCGPVRSRFARRCLPVAGWLAGAAVVIALSSVSDRAPGLYHGGLLLYCLACAGLLFCLVQASDSRLHRLLSHQPAVYVGTISYGLYLWHWPVFLLLDHTRTGWSGADLLAVRLAVTLVLSAVSHKFIEQPVRRWAPAGRCRLTVVPAAVTATALMVAVSTSAIPPPPVLRPVVFSRPVVAVTGVGSSAPAAPPVRVLVVGDSVALTLALGLHAAQQPYRVNVISDAILGCGIVRVGIVDMFGRPVTSGPCLSWPQTWATDVNQVDPAVSVVLVGRWEVIDRVWNGRRTHIGDPAFDANLLGELRLAVDVLSARGGRVVLLTAPYFAGQERPDGGARPEDDPLRVDRFNELLRAVALGSGGRATVLNLGAMLAPQSRFTASIDGVQVRWSDGIHISLAGGEWLAPRLLPEIAQIGSRAGTSNGTIGAGARLP